MDCEICGKASRELFLVSVEGTRLRVCPDCSGYGTFISRVEEEHYDPRPIVVEEKPEIDLVDNYARLISDARKNANLTQEELAKKINESLNVIKKVEKGDLLPTERLSKKLEKTFRIRLFQIVKHESVGTKKSEASLSLEDVAVMKK